MFLFVLLVALGVNASTYSQRQRQVSTAELRDLEEERRNAEAERRMSTAQQRDLQQERQARTAQIQRELQERRQQLEQQRQQRENQMPTGVRRDIEEERRNAEAETRMSTAARRDLQQERQERTAQIPRELQKRREQQRQSFRSKGNNNSFGQVNQANVAQDTDGQNYYSRSNQYSQRYSAPNQAPQRYPGGDSRAYGTRRSNLNRAEIFLYSQNPQLVPVVDYYRRVADAETVRRFGASSGDDASDAFRHAYGSALLSRALGPHAAKAVTDAHEMTIDNPPNSRYMDLYNNSVGIGIGQSYPTRGLNERDIADLTERALRGGSLVILRR